ncbi:MAG: hypothetical protein ACRDRL_01110, partial [Sciscionella sp.]
PPGVGRTACPPPPVVTTPPGKVATGPDDVGVGGRGAVELPGAVDPGTLVTVTTGLVLGAVRATGWFAQPAKVPIPPSRTTALSTACRIERLGMYTVNSSVYLVRDAAATPPARHAHTQKTERSPHAVASVPRRWLPERHTAVRNTFACTPTTLSR